MEQKALSAWKRTQEGRKKLERKAEKQGGERTRGTGRIDPEQISCIPRTKGPRREPFPSLHRAAICDDVLSVREVFRRGIKKRIAKHQEKKRRFPAMSFSASFLSMQTHVMNIAMQKLNKNDQDS